MRPETNYVEENLSNREVPPAQSEDGFAKALRLAIANSRLLRNAALIGLLIGVAIALALPNHYTTRARLMPPDNGPSAAMLAAVSSKTGTSSTQLTDMAGAMLGTKNTTALYEQVFRSHTVEDALIQKFDLRKVYWRKYYESTRKKLESRTDIDEDKKSGVIEISVTDSDKQRAKAILETYIDEANKALATVSTSSARRERIFIEGRIAKVQEDLKAAELRLSDFSAKNATLDVKTQAKAMLTAVSDLQAKIIAEQAELEGLQQRYTDDNIRVRTLKASIAGLQRELKKLGGTPGDELPSSEMYPSIRKLPGIGAKWEDLYRDAFVQQKLYEILVQQYETAKIQEAREIPVIKVLDPPQIPERKSWPPRAAIVVGMGLLATALVFGKVWVQDFRVSNPEHPAVVQMDMYLAALGASSGTKGQASIHSKAAGRSVV